MKPTTVSRLPAAVLVTLVQLLMLGAYDYISCRITECVVDDGSMRALAIFGPLVLLAFVSAYWVFVYPLFLWMRNWLSPTLSVPIGAALVALTACLVLHDQAVDKNIFTTMSYFFPAFFLPWMVGGYARLVLDARFRKVRES